MIALKAFFEALPIMLAVIAIVLCAHNLHTPRRKLDRVFTLVALMASGTMLLAQSSWWNSVLVQHSSSGEAWANACWTLFNSLVMVSYIIAASGHHDKE